MVEVFDDRVDIVSPGGLCKGITPENFGTVTIARNPIIASMFFRIDYIEQMGTGIGRMRNAAREAGVAEPEFEFSGFFKVTFRRNVTQSTAASDKQAIASDGQAIKTSDRKRAILSYFEKHTQATTADVSELLGLSQGRVRAILQEMTADGAIEKVGDKRYAYYILKP